MLYRCRLLAAAIGFLALFIVCESDSSLCTEDSGKCDNPATGLLDLVVAIPSSGLSEATGDGLKATLLQVDQAGCFDLRFHVLNGDDETLHASSASDVTKLIDSEIANGPQAGGKAFDLISYLENAMRVRTRPSAHMHIFLFVPAVQFDQSDAENVLDLAASVAPLLSVDIVTESEFYSGDFGSADCEQTYSDGSNLNMFSSIACLKSAGHSSSLQSQLLAVNVPTKLAIAGKSPDKLSWRWIAQTAASSVGLRTYTPLQVAWRDITEWIGTPNFVPDAIDHGEPIVFRNGTVVDSWESIKSWVDVKSFLADLGATEVFEDVKQSDSGRFMDADETAQMAPLIEELSSLLNYTESSMTAEAFFDEISGNDRKPMVHFFKLPKHLRSKLEPSRELFWSEDDYKLRKHFLWLSSGGAVTSLHFDQDHNFFVQIAGSKRFTLYPCAQHKLLRPYPRLHPLWHKPQVNIDNVNFSKFPEMSLAQPYSVVVEPGDVLYIPPYVWHQVETLEPSISLATLSHEDTVRNSMEFIYSMDHKFDLLVHPDAKIYALRLFLEMLLSQLYSEHSQTATTYFRALVHERYEHLRNSFAVDSVDSSYACYFNGTGVEESSESTQPKRGQIPMANHVVMDCAADVRLVLPAFSKIKKLDVRDFLVADYIEELVAGVVGVEHVLTFYEGCFSGQTYTQTDSSSRFHEELWRYYDEEIDGQLE